MTIAETDTRIDTAPRPPLGVGSLFSRTGRLLKRAFWPIVGPLFLLFALVQGGSLLWVQRLAGLGIPVTPDDDATDAGPSAIEIVSGAVGGLVVLVVFCGFYAAMLLVALRREAGGRTGFGEAVGTGLRFLLPMFVLSIVLGLLFGLGLVALVVPGLWLIGVYALAPVAMISDNRARGVMGRTRRLTKDYRWPLVGFFFLLYLPIALVSFAIGFAGAFLGIAPTDPTSLMLRSLLLDVPVSALSTAILLAGFVVAYRRLVEIKEGAGSGQLRSVFE